MSFKLLENPALLTVFHIFVCVCYFSVCCALFKKIFFYFNEIFLLSITDLKAQPLSRSEFEISLLPLGRFLKQYPGAA